jgi:alpha-beta hydrolase superfamily lysophospholipase
VTLRRFLLRWSVRAVLFGVALLAGIVVVFALQARVRLPDLSAWHTMRLREEFHAGRTDVATFQDYLRLEEKLFAEMQSRLLDDVEARDPWPLGKYHPGSVPARLARETPWNRSSVRTPPDPRGTVLLVHGLSDSPYSMRAIADTFYTQGYEVMLLRLPGHGTIPSALRDVDWKDWYAAVALAAKDAASRCGPGRPFLAGGHSTGAALLTLYALRSLSDPSLPAPQRLYLMSPAIGISGLAFLTQIVSALSFVPGLEKSDWVDVLPEYDPYKYNSFPVNAARQIYRVTRAVQEELDTQGEAGRLDRMPRILVFHSLVDATVKTTEVVRGLLGRLPAHGHELVVFDVNRNEKLQGLIGPAPLDYLERIRNAAEQPFGLTLVANQGVDSIEMATYTRPAGSRDVTVEKLPLAWPAGVISLGHVAIPFPPDDPVYGLAPRSEDGLVFPLGSFPARGEAGALVVPLATFARLRSNPFFDVIRAKVIESCRADQPAGTP